MIWPYCVKCRLRLALLVSGDRFARRTPVGGGGPQECSSCCYQRISQENSEKDPTTHLICDLHQIFSACFHTSSPNGLIAIELPWISRHGRLLPDLPTRTIRQCLSTKSQQQLPSFALDLYPLRLYLLITMCLDVGDDIAVMQWRVMIIRNERMRRVKVGVHRGVVEHFEIALMVTFALWRWPIGQFQ